MDDNGRRAEIAANLDLVTARVAAACRAAGRDPREVTVIAVTKTYPVADVAHLAALGVRDVGENRAQEAVPKAAELHAAGLDLRWHHVGQVQRNKARSIAGYAYAVHSVDRAGLVDALGAARARVRDEAGMPVLDVFVQVSLDGDTHRGGALPADVPALAGAIAAAPALRLAGVMAVAPLGVDPDAAFAALAAVATRMRRDHPGATAISAGMSADLEQAIAHGATHVRVGSALLGERVMLG